MDPEEFLTDPDRKQVYVTFMFDLIAPGYHLFTRLFSFGMDQKWKRLLVRELLERSSPTAVVADLACGTGDLASAIAARLPHAVVLGLDVSTEMIRVAARLRNATGRPFYAVCDVTHLSLRDTSLDAVTIGYGLRNLPDLVVGLREINGVLKAGGCLFILDFFRPRNRLWNRVFLAYLRHAGAFAGWLWHHEPDAFVYIARSVGRFVTLEQLAVNLSRCGFETPVIVRRLGGGIGVLVAQKSLRSSSIRES